MLRNWAIAEATNVRRWDDLKEFVSGEVLEKLETGNYDSLAEGEWHQLEQMIAQFRRPLLEGLLRLRPQWYLGDLASSHLSEIRVIKYQPFVQVAPSRTLGDFVAFLEKGGSLPNDPAFAENVKRIRTAFKIEMMRGRPILVSAELSGSSYYLVEGYSRLSAMLLGQRAGTPMIEAIPVMLGATARINEWIWY